MMLPCMKIAVSSVSQTGIGVSRRPGTGTCTTPSGVGIARTASSVTTSRPEMISAGTCT
jgi:hypothetical protein